MMCFLLFGKSLCVFVAPRFHEGDSLRHKGLTNLNPLLVIDLRNRFCTADSLDILEYVRHLGWRPYESLDLVR